MKFAREILKRKKMQPTKVRLEMLLKHPYVLAEAQKRLDFHETMLEKIGSIEVLFRKD